MAEKQVGLTNGEWAVYECLWESAPLTLTQLAGMLTERVGWSKSTGETVVSRMEKKGVIRYQQGKKAKLYYPIIRREDAVLSETKAFLDKVYSGSVGMMISAMAEREALSKEEIDELYEILKNAEKKETL